ACSGQAVSRAKATSVRGRERRRRARPPNQNLARRARDARARRASPRASRTGGSRVLALRRAASGVETRELLLTTKRTLQQFTMTMVAGRQRRSCLTQQALRSPPLASSFSRPRPERSARVAGPDA